MTMAQKNHMKWMSALLWMLMGIIHGLVGCSHLPVTDDYLVRLDSALGIKTTQSTHQNEQWYSIYCEGKKTGWRHLSESSLYQSGQRLKLHVQTTYEKYFRYGQAVEEKQIIKMLHDNENRFVAGAAIEFKSNQTPTMVEVKKTESALKVRLWRGESERRRTIRQDVDNLYPLIEQIRMLHPKVGLRKKMQQFDPDNLSVYEYTMRVISRLDLDLPSGNEPAWYVLVERNRSPYRDIYISADGKGRVLKVVCHEQPYVYLPASMHEAKTGLEKYDFNAIHDIKLASPIASSWSAQTVILDISNAALNRVLIETPWQSRSESSGTAGTRWKIRSRRVDDAMSQNLPMAIEDSMEFLNASFYIQSDHPKIREAAVQIKGSESNALRLFRKIAMWVFNTIEEKNYKTSMATALETLERKQGDCTEHAFLTAALARAAGIPTRIAAGLYYAQGSFAYHMWVEALVDDNLWAAVDPGIGQIEPDALHLKIYQGDFDINPNTNITWGLIQSLKADDLKIVAIDKTF